MHRDSHRTLRFSTRCLIVHCVCKTLFVLFFSAIAASLAQAENSTLVGASLPLTGDLAAYGTAVRNGIDLAERKNPELFRAVTFVFEDNGYDAKKAISNFQFFSSVRKVRLLYSWGEVPYGVLAPLAEKNKLPLVAMSLDPAPGLRMNYAIRSLNSPKEYTQGLVSVLRQKGYRRVGIVQMEDPYISASISGLRSNLQPGETLEILATVLPGQADLKAEALRASAAKIDVLGVYLYPGQISSFYRNLAAIRSKVPTFGTDIFENRAEIAEAGPAMDDAIYPTFEVPKEFSEEYLKIFGNDAEISYAYNAYATAIIIALAIKHAGLDATPAQIVQELSAVRGDEAGFTFGFRETEEGDKYFEFPVLTKRIRAGAFELYSPN